ncbi:MAG: tRNA lysidine(34) synthetase TilS [Cyclobacteriaceae bacterium]
MNKLFTRYLSKLIPNYQQKKYLLTVSGGVDSVVLARLFHESGLQIGIAHCNFQLRGKEANKDQESVKQLASELDVPFHSIAFDTKQFATERKLSTQMAARELRYTWFEKIRNENDYDFIVTAHHANDVAETVLYNLTKETGIAGVHGIKAINGALLRPLLFTTKEKIRSYAEEKGWNWREDISNEDTHYKRNFIRQKVVPLLEEINTNAIKGIANSSERFYEAEKMAKTLVEASKRSLIQTKGDQQLIHKENLLAMPSPIFVVNELLKGFGFTYHTLLQVVDSVTNQPGASFYSTSHRILVDREYLVVTEKKEVEIDQIEVRELPTTIQVGDKRIIINETDDTTFSNETDEALLNTDKVQLPLVIRKWKEGDRFRPLGMKGFKKVSDFLIDNKVSMADKENTLVVLSGNEICWTVGMRIDDRFKLKNGIQKAIRLKLEGC